MNQEHFKEICEATAFSLGHEPLLDDGRYSFSIDNVEVVLAFDATHDPDSIACYIDLGVVSPDDKARVCEQLLELNLKEHSAYGGGYAFDIGMSRAIFCTHLLDADVLDGEYIADALRTHVENTEAARRMVADPLDCEASPLEEGGDLFMAAMA